MKNRDAERDDLNDKQCELKKLGICNHSHHLLRWGIKRSKKEILSLSKGREGATAYRYGGSFFILAQEKKKVNSFQPGNDQIERIMTK